MPDIPEELKLTDAQIIDALWKLTTIVKGLRENQDFLIEQMLKQGLTLQKKQIGEGYFRRSLQDNFKETYEKIEGLFSKVKELSGVSRYGKYNKYDNG